MATFRLSQRAKADLLDIAVHTMIEWGEVQSDRHVDDLRAFCQRLAEAPLIGRACDVVSPGLRRMEWQKPCHFLPGKEGWHCGVACSA